MGGTWHIMSPLSQKVGGHVPRVPHQIAPMVVQHIINSQPCCHYAMRYSCLPIAHVHVQIPTSRILIVQAD